MSKLCLSCAVFTFLMFVNLPVIAVTIDINSKINNTQKTVVIYFDAGTHVLNPIGVADGGTYDAFSIGPGSAGDRVGTWRWQYSYQSAEIGLVEVNFGYPHDTESEAFAGAVNSSFTLSQGANVEFFIKDGPNGYEYSNDNLGGVSLSTVPIPPLLGSSAPV